MIDRAWRSLWIVGLVGFIGSPSAITIAGSIARSDGDVPTALVPFEHVVGAWKGVGIPSADKLRGWAERHLWAWAFREGEPIGLTIELEGNKSLKKGRLTFDKSSDRYRLEGTDPAGKAVAFVGTLDDKRQNLTLERTEPMDDGSRQRWIVRLIGNQIRYLIWDERQAKGATRFVRVNEMQMGKEGESFASGSTKGGNAPKCIITGGAATLTVSYNGKTYPVCCTGCRDEFEAEPERWLKKLAAKGVSGTISETTPTPEKPVDSEKAEPAEAPPMPDEKAPSAPGDSGPSKAAQQYQRAAELEKAGNTQAALIFYRIVVKDHAGTPEAKQAAERIRELNDRK